MMFLCDQGTIYLLDKKQGVSHASYGGKVVWCKLGRRKH